MFYVVNPVMDETTQLLTLMLTLMLMLMLMLMLTVLVLDSYSNCSGFVVDHSGFVVKKDT